jgi:hypothetical protein
MSSTEKAEILADALYSAAELAALFGFERVETIYEIPESELVPTRVGPRRGRKLFRGRDVMRYVDAGRPGGAPNLYEREAA